MSTQTLSKTNVLTRPEGRNVTLSMPVGAGKSRTLGWQQAVLNSGLSIGHVCEFCDYPLDQWRTSSNPTSITNLHVLHAPHHGRRIFEHLAGSFAMRVFISSAGQTAIYSTDDVRDLYATAVLSWDTPNTTHDKVLELLDNIAASAELDASDPLQSFDGYARPNWDGYGAAPITSDTLSYARRIIAALPDALGPPNIAPAGDGSVALEWVPNQPHNLDRLFLDIGPGEQWRAYWLLKDGSYDRLPGSGYSVATRHIFQKLFDDLNK